MVHRFFGLSTLQKRDVLNSGISHYINLYVIVYSLFLVLPSYLKTEKRILHFILEYLILQYIGAFS